MRKEDGRVGGTDYRYTWADLLVACERAKRESGKVDDYLRREPLEVLDGEVRDG